jgi:hypothetical protein
MEYLSDALQPFIWRHGNERVEDIRCGIAVKRTSSPRSHTDLHQSRGRWLDQPGRCRARLLAPSPTRGWTGTGCPFPGTRHPVQFELRSAEVQGLQPAPFELDEPSQLLDEPPVQLVAPHPPRQGCAQPGGRPALGARPGRGPQVARRTAGGPRPRPPTARPRLRAIGPSSGRPAGGDERPAPLGELRPGRQLVESRSVDGRQRST